MTVDELLKVVLENVPPTQAVAAKELLATYGPKLLGLTAEVAWSYIRRLLEGDLLASAELLWFCSDDEFIARIKVNTARWEGVAAASKAREDLALQFAFRVAGILLSILLSLVGL